MRTEDFDYQLPSELIAQYPLPNRDHSKMLVTHRSNSQLENKQFTDLIDYLESGDLLVFNDSKVMAARLFGHKASGGAIELLVERVVSDHQVLAHIRANKSPRVGSQLFVHQLRFEVLDKQDSLYTLKVLDGDIVEAMDHYGHIPLPPYMQRDDEQIDQQRYQTVYCKQTGSVAAPTAGLHFTESLIEQIRDKGVNTAFVTLHVGSGTFQPVKVSDIKKHQMHQEYIEVSEQVCDQVIQTKKQGGRVFAVGTTSVRCLETAGANGYIQPFFGPTDIFIYPGKKFHVVDALITNFHLPKSTLIMLVSAFATRELIFQAYQWAIDHRYRFYSYGDSMLIL